MDFIPGLATGFPIDILLALFVLPFAWQNPVLYSIDLPETFCPRFFASNPFGLCNLVVNPSVKPLVDSLIYFLIPGSERMLPCLFRPGSAISIGGTS